MSEPEALPAVVIGAGAAGLSASYFLKQHGIAHAVLERARVGDTWASQRWDSFTLVTPNWMARLPGMPYEGPSPGGFLPRDEIVGHLASYAARFGLPVRTGVEVQHLRPLPGMGQWEVTSNQGTLHAQSVVVSTGAYPDPHIPPSGRNVSPRVLQLHTANYRNPASLPEGAVLVVGTGQSAIQIADELIDAGRQVFVCAGKCPRAPRRYRGKDMFEWLVEIGFFEMTRADLPSDEVRLACNPQMTGRSGGYDASVWRLAKRGATLLGRWESADGEVASLEDNLERTLADSEAASRKILDDIDASIKRAGTEAPPPDWTARDFAIPAQEPRTRLDLKAAGISTLIWATGFRRSYGWIEGCTFSPAGFPASDRGVADAPGLYFLGIHFLHTRKSSLLFGVGEDASHVVEHLAARHAAAGKG